ncbi:hypothetical protein [Thiocapsa sp. N5-Cardenillas]|uniref:hypothetical protein n=1 Tax=Thiocapsa sp. N5-Cardenillas TaxID=3137397 RepID=UPI0035B06646
MNWTTLAPFVAQHGIEAGLNLYLLWREKREVTEADFETLRVLVNKTKEQYLEEARQRAGIEGKFEGGQTT